MKKASLLMMILGLFILTGCSNDDDDDVMPDLTGSTFSAFMYHDSFSDTDVYDTYRFTPDKKIEHTRRKGGPRGEIVSTTEGTYYVFYPSIHILIESEDFKGTFIDEDAFRIGSYEYLRQ